MEANILQVPARAMRWQVKVADEGIINHLSACLKIHPALCKILAVRGISSFEEAKAFFRPQLTDLHNPYLMKDMQKAVDRVAEAIEWNERILIYGDYDVDGTTAVSVLYSFLKKRYQGKLEYYIPHRYKEGYGLSKAGIEYASANGFTLIITLDCGIKSSSLVAEAKKLGIDVIICDHHLPDDDIPPAKAILNPKQIDCTYPFKELSGCGIGFKLICALCMHWKLPMEEAYVYLDLVATSIAADIVAMEDENRVLSFYGIKKANENPCASITALKKTANIDRPMSVADLVFVIGPRVNAAGRIDDATRAVDMFVQTDEQKVLKLAQELQLNNTERKEFDKQTTQEALQMLYNDPANADLCSTVIYRDSWHKGVVGIVASRLIDHFYRPTIVLTKAAHGQVAGSARSIKGFNIYTAIHECRDLLDNYGGHFFAAGLSMKEHNVPLFRERFEQIVKDRLQPEQLVPELEIDAEIQLRDISPAFYNIVRQLEPYGPGNLRPVFLTRRVYNFRGMSRVVKDTHLKIVVHQHDGITVDGIGFGMGSKESYLHDAFDLVYTLDENEFQGVKRLQLKVLDLRPSI